MSTPVITNATTTLGEVISASTEKADPLAMPDAAYIGLEHIEKDTGVINGFEKAASVRSTKSVFRRGDLLYGKLRPYLNKVWVAEFDGVCSTDILVYPKTENVDNRFLKYRFMSRDFVNYAAANSNGVNLPRVNAKVLAQFPLWLPPLDEQRRIVAEIEKQFTRLDAGVSALQRVRSKLKQYRAAALKAACEGRLVPTEAEQWEECSLGKVLTKIEAGKSFKCEERPPHEDEVGVVKVSAVTWGIYNEAESKTVLDKSRIEERFYIKPEDFLFSRANTIELVGACVIAEQVNLQLMLSDKILRFKFSEAVNPKWVLYWLRSQFGRQEIERLATGNQESMRNIGQDRIRQIAFMLPPLAEQERIVAEVERRLSVVDELEATVTANLQRAARLRQAILQKAFAGELVATEVPRLRLVDPQPLKSRRPNRHFMRAVLSGEIVYQLHNEPTFGRVEHQKILHLCEYIAELEEIEGDYRRKAAGPMDNKLFFSNENEGKKQKWYVEVTHGERHFYKPLEKAGEHRKYFHRYWPDKSAKIKALIELMRSWSTENCEIFSTAYAAWNDLLIWGKAPTEEAILHEIYNRWDDSKKRIPEKKWRKAISWMARKGFAPTGFGKPTALPE